MDRVKEINSQTERNRDIIALRKDLRHPISVFSKEIGFSINK